MTVNCIAGDHVIRQLGGISNFNSDVFVMQSSVNKQETEVQKECNLRITELCFIES